MTGREHAVMTNAILLAACLLTACAHSPGANQLQQANARQKVLLDDVWTNARQADQEAAEACTDIPPGTDVLDVGLTPMPVPPESVDTPEKLQVYEAAWNAQQQKAVAAVHACDVARNNAALADGIANSMAQDIARERAESAQRDQAAMATQPANVAVPPPPVRPTTPQVQTIPVPATAPAKPTPSPLQLFCAGQPVSLSCPGPNPPLPASGPP